MSNADSQLVIIELKVTDNVNGVVEWGKINPDSNTEPTLTLHHPDGSLLLFYKVPDGWAPVLSSEGQVAPGINVFSACDTAPMLLNIVQDTIHKLVEAQRKNEVLQLEINRLLPEFVKPSWHLPPSE